MSKVWKWILGIVAVLVIVAAVAGVVIVLRNGTNLFASNRPNLPNGQGQNIPNNQRGFGPDWNGRMPRENYGWGGPMMNGRGYSPFGFGPFGRGLFFVGSLLRILIPLGILALVAILFYQLGRRTGTSASTSVATATPAPEATSSRGRKVAK